MIFPRVPRSIRWPPMAPSGIGTTLTDSVSLTTPKGTSVRLYAVEIVPSRPGPSLVAGTIWLDSASAQVARFTFRYVGTSLWVDRDDPDPDLKELGGAKKANAFINRILTVDSDLEYGLQDERYWMPSRQVLSGTLQIPIVSDIVIPFEAITTFWDYDINSGRPVVFETPPPDSGAKKTMDHESDSLARGGSVRQVGQRTVRGTPSAGGQLKSYAAWGDSLKLNLDPQEDQQVRDGPGAACRADRGVCRPTLPASSRAASTMRPLPTSSAITGCRGRRSGTATRWMCRGGRSPARRPRSGSASRMPG